MSIRALLFVMLNLVHIAVLAMDGQPGVPRFLEIVKEGPSQDVHTLLSRINTLQSSIMFFVPKDSSRMPFIGYSICSCQKHGLEDNRVHKDIMIAMFKAVLARLASKGFDRVRFTATLLRTPPCLSDFINDPWSVPIISQDGAEIIISTHMPPSSQDQ